MNEIVSITIDGKQVKARSGQTILEAALAHGVEIPNLCRHQRLSHTAACRLCVVYIEGRPGAIPSCTTKVEDGMKITAFNDDLERVRRMTLDLALSNHKDDCISCVKDGGCELQDLAFRYNLGRDDRRLPPVWEELHKTSDFSSQVLNYDASKCIQCERCIKSCAEIQGKGVLSFANRGIRATVSTGFTHWKESKCDGCGECVQSCPTGALTSKNLYGSRKRVRKKDVENSVVTTCPYCGVGCQLEVSTGGCTYCDSECVTAGTSTCIMDVAGADLIPNYGSTCVKGRYGLDFIGRPDRLQHPLIRRDGELVEVPWNEAITYASRRLLEIKEKHGPNAIGGLSSARCTNEENFIFQKFVRSVVGTNNVDHCARLCHASTVAGLATTLGSGAMTNSIAELEDADVILVTGSNTTETHPVISTRIKRAVREHGAKLIVVDPRRIDLVRYASVWLRQNNGTDVAWLNGFMNVILAEGLEDRDFIEKRTEGFAELKEVVEKYTPEHVEEITGIAADDLRTAARIYAGADTASIVYSMGITQHSNGTDNVKSVANLAMITGNLGRASTGVNPLRGQNNVQGACDMGALPNVYPGYQKVVDPTAQAKFERAWRTSLSAEVGLTVVEMMHAAHSGELKALYIMGENPMVSDPNLNHVEEALDNIEFLICQDIFLTETAQKADVVFPAASFGEKVGTFTNTERRILPVRPFMKPVGDSRPDWRIVQHVAQGMGFFWEYSSVEDIRAEMCALTPQYGGITHARITAGEMLQWPCPTADHPGTKYLHEGEFARGLGLLSAIEHTPPQEMPDEEFPFVLSTGRILYHWHTGTMTRRSQALTDYVDEGYAEMHKDDLAALGVSAGEKVRVSSRRGSIDIVARETNKVNKGSLFIPFHFAEAAANRLTIDALDPVAKIPEFKVCAVKVEAMS